MLFVLQGKMRFKHSDQDLVLNEGEIVSLLGRNGVGRSTTCKTIMGLVSPKGSILYQGHEIAGLKPHLIARRGIGFVPEDRWIFPGLTVQQKLNIALKISQRLYIMGHGRIVFEGSPDDLKADESIRREWLEV